MTSPHPVLNDSKQLSETKRERLYEEITGDERICWHCVGQNRMRSTGSTSCRQLGKGCAVPRSL